MKGPFPRPISSPWGRHHLDFMSEDLIDRIVRERGEGRQATEAKRSIAAAKAAAVGADEVMPALASHFQFCAEKYDRLLGGSLTFFRSGAGQGPHVEVRQEAPPISVSVVQSSPQLMTFEIDRTDGRSLEHRSYLRGRIEVKADVKGDITLDVYTSTYGASAYRQSFRRAEDLAEYLLEPALVSRPNSHPRYYK